MTIQEEYSPFVERYASLKPLDRVSFRTLHAMLGIVTEAGEFADAIKKTLAYGKPLDEVNLDEECGDLLWYVQLYLNGRGKTIDQILQQNMMKLRQRYGSSFNSDAALTRDLASERKTLEDNG